MRRIGLLITILIVMTGCNFQMKLEEDSEKVSLIRKLNGLEAFLPNDELRMKKWLESYNEYYNTLQEKYNYQYEGENTFLKDMTMDELINKGIVVSNQGMLQDSIDSREEEFYKSDTSVGRYVWLEGIANVLVECGEVCTSNLISYEDAKKWVETGEYNVEWTYVDGELVNPPMTENDSNSSDDISTYKSLELTIDNSQFTGYGHIEVEGSITNPTDKSYRYVQLKVKLLDVNGNVIDTENTYAVGFETLSPGDTKKWDVMFKDDSRADNVEVEIVDYKIK